MALVINNRVRELTSTTGTGAVTLGGAVGGFQTFAAGIGNDNTTYYAISINSENEWEVGLGTLNADSSTLTRTTVLESSNSDSAVDFAAGSQEVFCTLPSEKAVYLDASGAAVGAISNVVEDTSPELGGNLDVNGNDILSTGTAVDSVQLVSAGGITLDANNTGATGLVRLDSAYGGSIHFAATGTDFGQIYSQSSDVVIRSMVSDKDLHLKGNDGGSTIVALTFDMSEGGPATFLSTATAAGGQLTTTGIGLVFGT